MTIGRWTRAAALVLAGSIVWATPLGSVLADEPGEEGAVDVPAADPATQASTPPAGLEAITVTSRKRAEDQQTVPISISTMTGEDFNNQNMQLFEDIQFSTPGLTFRQTVGRKHILGAQMRGLFAVDSLITTDPAVGFYIDDVYSARISGINISLFDLDRIETLKGPQGVLFGKNSIGGAIKVHSKMPDGSFGGFGRLRFGTDNQTDFEGAVQFPILGEQLSARLAFLSHHRDGVVDHKSWPGCPGACGAAAPPNSIRDEYENNAIGGRASVVWRPDDSWEIMGQGQWMQSKEPDPNPAHVRRFDPGSTAAFLGNLTGLMPTSQILGVVEQTDAHDSFTSFTGNVDLDSWGYTLNIAKEFDTFTLRAISGWRKFQTRELRDQDGTPWSLRHTKSLTRSRQFTQELQISGVAAERFEYTAGLYWNNENTKFNEGSLPLFFQGSPAIREPAAPSDTQAKARGYGIYGHLSYALTERTDIWGGIRTTYDRREMDRFIPNDTSVGGGPTAVVADRRYDAVTWGFGLDFQMTDDLFLYGKIEKGFRAGGVNGRGNGALFNAGQLEFDPEFLTSYEIGAKTEWFDNRLRANVATYYAKYKDIQTTIFIPAMGTSITSRGNSGTADVSGGELEVTALPLPGLQLGGGLALNYFRYVNGVLASGPPTTVNRLGGRQDRGTPELQLNLNGSYTLPAFSLGRMGDVELTARLDYSYRSKQKSESQACNPDTTADPPIVHPCSFPRSILDIGAYGVLSGRITAHLPQYNVEVAFWGRNILDREYEVFNTNFNTTGFLGFTTTNYGEPARFGVDITYRFGSETL